MNFYTKVLSKFTASKGAKVSVRVSVEVVTEEGLSPQKVEEAKVALRELGLTDQVKLT
jgi:hypothetical protein